MSDFAKKRRNDNNSLRVFTRCYFSATGGPCHPRNRSDLNSGNIDEKECVRGMGRWKATEAYALFSANHCRRHTHTILIHLGVSRFYGAQAVHAGAQDFGSCYCCSPPPPSSTISGNVFGGNFSLHTAATGGWGMKLNFTVLEVNFSEEHRSEVCP